MSNLLKTLLFAAFCVVAHGQVVVPPASAPGSPVPLSCVGSPGNTIGSYLQLCQTSAGALYACNNVAGCTVAADWVAQGGSGSPATASNGCVQYNSSGSFGCNSGILAGPGVSGQGLLYLTYTAPDSAQAETININPFYSGAVGVSTLSAVYSTNHFAATGGTTTHVISYVDNSVDSSTGSGVAPALMAGFASNMQKTGSSTGGSYSSFFASSFTHTAGTSNSFSSFNAAVPTVSGGTLNNAYGLLVPSAWAVATGDNCGVCIGGTGFVPAGVWTPFAVAVGTSLFGGRVTFNSQTTTQSSGTYAILDFGNNASQRAASTGEFVGMTGSISVGGISSGTVATVAGFDLQVGNNAAGTATITNAYGAKISMIQNNGGVTGTQVTYDAGWGIGSGTLSGNGYGFKAEDVSDNSGSITYSGNLYGVYVGKVHPTTAVLSGSAYSAYFSDASAPVYVAGNVYSFAQKSTSGQRYVCITTAGEFVSSATACSGT